MRYRFGLFEFDAETGQLRRNERAVPLERQPSRALHLLLTRAGELVPRDHLRVHIWGRDTHVDVDRGLAYCVSQVRAALGDRGDSPRFIQTVPKRGYTFIAPVTRVEPQPAPDLLPPAPASLLAREAPGPERTGPAVATPVRPPTARRLLPVVAAVAALACLVVGAWFYDITGREPVRVAVSVFDNETGVRDYDRPTEGLADLVVARLANLAPGRLAVIGNAEILRQPRNIRNLKAVAAGLRAEYVLLGQLQRGEEGLRFVTHVIRLSDLVHLKANRLTLDRGGIAGLERAVVAEFERAVREHVLTNAPK